MKKTKSKKRTASKGRKRTVARRTTRKYTKRRRTMSGLLGAPTNAKAFSKAALENSKYVGLMTLGGVGAHALDNLVQNNAENANLRKFSPLLLAILFLAFMSASKNSTVKLLTGGAAVVALYRFVKYLLNNTQTGAEIASKAATMTTMNAQSPAATPPAIAEGYMPTPGADLLGRVTIPAGYMVNTQGRIVPMQQNLMLPSPHNMQYVNPALQTQHIL